VVHCNHRVLIGGLLALSIATSASSASIDRKALVTRHNPTITRIDAASPFMVGNGNIAFTADITGLQTFQAQYSPLVPLMTQAQWAWHSFPNPDNHRLEDALVPIDVRGSTQRYPWLTDWSQAQRPAIAWLRENPHRFSLGRLSLYLVRDDGTEADYDSLCSTRQTLDLWSGMLSSAFVLDGHEVAVRTRVHPELDMIMVDVKSDLLAKGRLAVDLAFPGVNPKLNPDPANWDGADTHRTRELTRSSRQLSLRRELDAMSYHVRASTDADARFESLNAHAFRIQPDSGDTLALKVAFSERSDQSSLPGNADADVQVAEHWRRYWADGAVVDFSGSRDPRARELERRIVLSQYLMALNAAGTLPPQEEGLFSNSWNGKFHLEMHFWHSAHFALWGRTALLERSMPWYLRHLEQAKARAAKHGVRGAWWPKMTGPDGRESPSTINPFIMWQQPHPIHLAELIYRDGNSREVLERYRELVFESAELLASFPHWDEARGQFSIGPPIIPAQEVWPPLSTQNPTFELEYFRYGLATAQRWRERLGLKRDPRWDRVLQELAALPQREGLYLATQSHPDLWQQARTPACTPPATNTACMNRDHPSMLGALGMLPGNGTDRRTMQRTLDAVMKHWDLRQTWGWDFPFIAMTATRLHQPERALEVLFLDLPNNRYGLAGMTPRVHLVESDRSTSEVQYHRDAETYFPSNGSLLLAVALMVAGWEGNDMPLPGFPKNGQWNVRSEGLRPLP
jgi:hypothetical protein